MAQTQVKSRLVNFLYILLYSKLTPRRINRILRQSQSIPSAYANEDLLRYAESLANDLCPSQEGTQIPDYTLEEFFGEVRCSGSGDTSCGAQEGTQKTKPSGDPFREILTKLLDHTLTPHEAGMAFLDAFNTNLDEATQEYLKDTETAPKKEPEGLWGVFCEPRGHLGEPTWTAFEPSTYSKAAREADKMNRSNNQWYYYARPL